MRKHCWKRRLNANVRGTPASLIEPLESRVLMSSVAGISAPAAAPAAAPPYPVPPSNTASITDNGLNSMAYSPKNGNLMQLLVINSILTLRVRAQNGTWSDEPITADPSGVASLTFSASGQPQVLMAMQPTDLFTPLNGIARYKRSGGAWSLTQSISDPFAPTGDGSITSNGFQSFQAVVDSHFAVHIVLTQVIPTDSSDPFGYQIVYGTNKTGAWKWEHFASKGVTNDTLTYPNSDTPRFFSIAVDASQYMHIVEGTNFQVTSEGGETSSLEYFSNNPAEVAAQGAGSISDWSDQYLYNSISPATDTLDAGLGCSIAINPVNNRPAVAEFYLQNAPTGSVNYAQLRYLNLKANEKVWNMSIVATKADGYVAGDGNVGTGFAPDLAFNSKGQPDIGFSDLASQHFNQTGEDEFAGQIRNALLVNGQWQIITVYSQRNAIANEVIDPVIALSPKELSVLGTFRADTLDSNLDITSTDEYVESLSLALA